MIGSSITPAQRAAATTCLNEPPVWLLDELLERVTEEPARNAPATLLALAREIATARGLL